MSLIYHNVDLLPIVKRVIPEIRDNAMLVITKMPTFIYPDMNDLDKLNSVDLKRYEAPREDGTIIQFTGALIEIYQDQYFVLLESIPHVAMHLIAYDNDREAS